MDGLFNFSPLFFFRTEHFMHMKQALASPMNQLYSQGRGYDQMSKVNTSQREGGSKQMEWVSNMFSSGVDKRMFGPHMLPSIGQPLDILTNVSKAKEANLQSVLYQLESEGQNPIVQAFGSFGQQVKPTTNMLTSKDGMMFTQMMRQALQQISMGNSLTQSAASQLQANGKLINGKPINDELLTGGQNLPVQLADQMQGSYTQLQDILKMADKRQMGQILSFGYGAENFAANEVDDIRQASKNPLIANSLFAGAVPDQTSDKLRYLSDMAASQIRVQKNMPPFAQQVNDQMKGKLAQQFFIENKQRELLAKSMSRFQM